MCNMPNPGSGNHDPELSARHAGPQSLRARFEGTLLVIGALILALVVLSVVLSII